jgi:hypothetical protein
MRIRELYEHLDGLKIAIEELFPEMLTDEAEDTLDKLEVLLEELISEKYQVSKVLGEKARY